MLFNVIVVSVDGVLLLSYYFADCMLPAQDEWEFQVAAATKDLWPHATKPDALDICCVCGDRAVVLRGRGDLVYILSGDDELELAYTLDGVVSLVNAVCEQRPSSKLLAESHGKIVVCLSTMFISGGAGAGAVQAYSDVEAVLRNAKLKAPHV